MANVDFVSEPTAPAPAADTNGNGTPKAGHNQSMTRAKFMASVKKFGETSGAGKNSQAQFALLIVRAANEGIITSAKYEQKDANGYVDDAETAFMNFIAAESSKSVFDHTSTAQNASKVRQIVKFGELAELDPVETFDRALEQHKKARDAGAKTKPAYATLVDVARTGLANKRDLEDDALYNIALRPAPKEKEMDKELRRIADALEAIITGEKGKKALGFRDEHPATEQAYNLLMERIKNPEYAAKQFDDGYPHDVGDDNEADELNARYDAAFSAPE